MKLKASWYPNPETIQNSNIYKMMLKNGFEKYEDFWKWSVDQKSEFWSQTISNLSIKLTKKYTSVVDVSRGVEQAQWLKGAQLNIIDSCFQNDDEATAVIFQKAHGNIEKVTQKQLEQYVNRIANSLVALGLKQGDYLAIDMPMTLESVAIYLAGIKAGNPVVTIADSFSSNEIEVRLKITKPKVIFTQDVLQRADKTLALYEKVKEAKAPKAIVIKVSRENIPLRENDIYFHDFLVDKDQFDTVVQNPDDIITVLFSSGTTGAPKAIPWTHTTPIKSASDAYYHQNIQKNDVVCWPTNLGWMMGPWLVFAALINKASMALYDGAPMGEDFGSFVEHAEVSMLGVVPSIVRNWKTSACMENLNWDTIKCFSSTGEASNPEEMIYLMQLANNKPVIEYCGGTEIGGGYVTSTVIQPNIASTFSSQALGGAFVLLDENDALADKGEMFLIPPIMGLSNTLLNRDHHEVYYKGTPKYQGQILRKHGDQLECLENGYYRAQGRADDAMNLGGIKVSSIQIEAVINKLDFIKESAAVAIEPKTGGPSYLVIYYVESHSDQNIEERLQKARQIIRSKLNPLFKVHDLILIKNLPRTASGKVMRRKLRATYKN
ncbi:MAG: AMP-binding protein [Flavobacteriaceae bacterium]|nr:AMP-binding protein [Flavobacteriaceae bacterium]